MHECSHGGGLHSCTFPHGRRQRGAAPPLIFKLGRNIVDRGLNVLFFGLFCYFRPFFTIFSVFFSLPPSRENANSALFRYFLLILGLFFVGPSWKIFCRRPCLPSTPGKSKLIVLDLTIYLREQKLFRFPADIYHFTCNSPFYYSLIH